MASFFQMHLNGHQGSRGYTGNSGGLAKGYRSHPAQLLPHLPGESVYRFIVNIFEEPCMFGPSQFLHLPLLAGDIPFVFYSGLHLFGDQSICFVQLRGKRYCFFYFKYFYKLSQKFAANLFISYCISVSLLFPYCID